MHVTTNIHVVADTPLKVRAYWPPQGEAPFIEFDNRVAVFMSREKLAELRAAIDAFLAPAAQVEAA